MKGVCLCGGSGTRLKPLTNIISKCLLPIHDKPMVFYALKTLVDAGIDEIILVCGGTFNGEFMKVIGDGKDLGIKNLCYTVQREPKGIAHALATAESCAKGDSVALILGDNIFTDNIKDVAKNFSSFPIVIMVSARHFNHVTIIVKVDIYTIICFF